MNLEPTEEQRALRGTVRRFLASAATKEMWRDLADLGATGILIPDEFGGAGLAMSNAVIVAEEAGAALLSEPWLSTAVSVPRAVHRFGAEAAAADLLAGIADGMLVATVALPGTPLTVSGGAVSGELAGVPDAATCDVLLVVASHPDGAGLYRVDARATGVAIAEEPGFDPTRGTATVVLTNAPATLLGSACEDAATALVDDVFTATAADALGAAQRLVDTVVEYAKTRTQFGQPIGSFQSVAHLCVDMYETVELTRGGVVHAAWAADDADATERHLSALRLKAFAARLASVGDTAIQVLGGIGFTREHDAHLHLRKLLSWSTLLGGSDSYLERVGELFVESVARSADS